MHLSKATIDALKKERDTKQALIGERESELHDLRQDVEAIKALLNGSAGSPKVSTKTSSGKAASTKPKKRKKSARTGKKAYGWDTNYNTMSMFIDSMTITDVLRASYNGMPYGQPLTSEDLALVVRKKGYKYRGTKRELVSAVSSIMSSPTVGKYLFVNTGKMQGNYRVYTKKHRTLQEAREEVRAEKKAARKAASTTTTKVIAGKGVEK